MRIRDLKARERVAVPGMAEKLPCPGEGHSRAFKRATGAFSERATSTPQTGAAPMASGEPSRPSPDPLQALSRPSPDPLKGLRARAKAFGECPCALQATGNRQQATWAISTAQPGEHHRGNTNRQHQRQGRTPFPVAPRRGATGQYAHQGSEPPPAGVSNHKKQIIITRPTEKEPRGNTNHTTCYLLLPARP